MLKDTKYRRLGFFSSYIAQIVIVFMVEIYIFINVAQNPQLAEEVCHDIKEQQHEQGDDMGAKEVKNCEKIMKSDMTNFMMAYLVFSVMFSAYFAFILGLHWMNSDKPERRGGVPKPQKSV